MRTALPACRRAHSQTRSACLRSLPCRPLLSRVPTCEPRVWPGLLPLTRPVLPVCAPAPARLPSLPRRRALARQKRRARRLSLGGYPCRAVENAALTKRQQSVLLLIGKLQALSSSPAAATANKSEIEALVAAAARSFSPQDEAYDFPGDALGYTMKPTGGTVAGKVW